ncbi:MAG TPA: hypothetical protein ENN41_05360 [Sediminispirochaeta sp.]|nr:hypothetical protein [Sediminispirochaeta sp.]
MPLQPIDMQTLFAHLNQVGKQQAHLKAGAVVQQELQGNIMAKEALHKDETVNETDETPENDKIKDKEKESSGGKSSQRKGRKEKEKEESEKQAFYEDPALGKNIDITG